VASGGPWNRYDFPRPIGFALVWRSCYNAAELEVGYLDN
jgi:hypothetical protein